MPAFFYGHLAGIHHSAARGSAAGFDVPFRNWLTKRQTTPGMQDSILIVVADHGSRTHKGNTVTTRLEERLPLLGLLLPEWFKTEHPDLVATARANAAQRIVTSPYDVHATLRHLMFLRDHDAKAQAQREAKGSWSTSPHYRSLFEPLEMNRTCEDAGIPVHFCVCHSWKKIAASSTNVQRAAATFIEYANGLMQRVNDTCAVLRLQDGAEAVSEAFTLQVKHSEMTTLGRKTDRHGRSNVIEGSKNVETGQHVRLTLRAEALHPSGNVLRNDMRFEVTVDEQGGIFSMREALRNDIYGSDPLCIQDQLPHLRKFCKCVE
jgi:hypothetical protein